MEIDLKGKFEMRINKGDKIGELQLPSTSGNTFDISEVIGKKTLQIMAERIKDKEMDIEQCPFLVDDKNIKKIRNAKEIIISRMTEPPTLTDLATEVEISLKKLKEGFKQVYGASVYVFLLDYKMQVSKRLLSSGNYNVNEVALKVGYSTATHFINAFKKKFGTTPKKYLMSL